MSQALVQLKQIHKSYDGRTDVLSDVNLDIQKGEFITFLGPSGSGKTTLLMILAGFEVPSQGDVLVAGKTILGSAPHKRNMGVVFQNYALFPHMSVADNIGFSLRQRRWEKPRVSQRVRELLDMVELTELGDRMPSQLSGGQRQRVAIARALAFTPDIVLLDEPLSALDRNLREQMQLELKRLHSKTGLTFVLVTHDQDEALTMSDRIVVFDNGKIQQCADPETMYRRPVNQFVAGFVGDNNRLSGVADGSGIVRIADTSLKTNSALSGAVNVFIRPDKLKPIAEGTVLGEAQSALECTILDQIFHGQHRKILARCIDGQELVCIVPSDFADDAADNANRYFGVHADDCVVFDAR